MTWTKKNALNRWCLRTLQQNCASPLHNLLHEAAGLAVLAQARHKGRPPLQNACLGDHCDHWQAVDTERGTCRYRQDLKAELGKLRSRGK